MNYFGIKSGVNVKDREGWPEHRKTFVKSKFEVASFNNIVEPGNYVFPFKMPVDPVRPATNFGPMTREIIAGNIKTQYKLKAQVIGPDFIGIAVKHTIPIELLQAVPLPIVPSQVYKDEMVSTSCCCYSPQNLKCTAITDKNAYAPGENLILTVLADASGFSKSLTVTAYLCKAMIWNTRPMRNQLLDYVQNASLAEIPAGKKIQSNVTMTIPTDVTQTQLGGIFMKWHYLVRVHFNVSCGGFQILDVPIIIYGMPTLQPQPTIALPPGRAPFVNEPVILEPSKAIYPY